jgi:hypothetical protein
MRIQEIIPLSVRKFLLKQHQDWLWTNVLNEYRMTIEADRLPSKELIKKLVYAWGNQGFQLKLII